MTLLASKFKPKSCIGVVPIGAILTSEANRSVLYICVQICVIE